MGKISLKFFLFSLIVSVVTTFSYPLNVKADFEPVRPDVLITDKCLPYSCFWGIIIKKQLKLCLIKVDGLFFPIPNPVAPAFHYYWIAQPWPPLLHKLYYVFTIVPGLPPFGGTTKLRDRREKTVYVVGAFLPGVQELYRQTCTFNKDRLPGPDPTNENSAMGTIKIWGTGCKPGEVVPIDTGKCKQVKK